MAIIAEQTKKFLRNPSAKRGGFAGFFAEVVEGQAKKQGKVFNRTTNKFELPRSAKILASPPVAKAKAKTPVAVAVATATKPKKRVASVIGTGGRGSLLRDDNSFSRRLGGS